MNGTKKSANFKIQKILQIQKGLLSCGATGWMLHFNVRNTNCLLNNMSFGTCCWEGNWCYAHWNEASSLLHHGSKVLFESARFFVSYNLLWKELLRFFTARCARGEAYFDIILHLEFDTVLGKLISFDTPPGTTTCVQQYRRVSRNVVTMETSAIGWPPWLVTFCYLRIWRNHMSMLNAWASTSVQRSRGITTWSIKVAIQLHWFP